jgi:PAS domain S-box-containing protein
MNQRWAPPLELLSEFVTTIARDFTILYTNRTVTLPKDQVIGRSIDDFLTDESRDRVHRAIEEVFTTREARRIDSPARINTNMIFETAYHPLIEDGEVVAVVGVARDVTRQRNAELLLSQRQGLLQALLHAFPDMVFRVNGAGVILDFSGDASETLHPPEQFLNKNVKETLPQEVAAILLDAVWRVLREEGVVTVDYELTIKNELRYYEARLVRSGADEALAIVRNRTLQRHMEQRLLRADRIASLGALAAGVAHEINNPLTYVIGNLTLATRELASFEVGDELAGRMHELQRALADARAGADRVRYIVSDLNSFSAAPRTDLAVVDLRKVLDSAINMAWSEIRHRARLVRDYQDGPGVLGNEHRLGQVFLNLLVNAAQAIEEGDAQKNTIYVRTDQENGTVVVSIQDSGRGFDQDVAARMFDPFFTTKPIGEGTGLGLAICRSILDSLGGQLTASSPGFGRGATFTVRLPAAEYPLEVRPAQVIERHDGDPIRGRVLVVDDEPVIATLARRALGNHEVYVVTSGSDALELCGAQEFDVILCDLLMPDVTGMDLYESLSAQGNGVEQRMVFMTAGAFTPRARRFLSQISNPHLEKPFDVDDLEAAVQRALRARG